MCPVKIVNACVHNLLIRKILIKFDVIMERDLSRVNYTSCPMGILISS